MQTINSRKVTKAVITAAGFGTRFLPATKTVPKEILPVIDTPTIHYIVEEVVNSGIDEIIIVTKHGNYAIEDYFDSLTDLESFLEERGKIDKLEQIKQAFRMAKFAYVRQNNDLPYGNGSPILAAKPFIGDSNFVVAWGDDLTLSQAPVFKQLIDIFEKSDDCEAVMAAQEVPANEINRYASVKFKDGSSNVLDYLIEKPEPGKEFSNLASFGRYVCSPKIFDYLKIENTGKDNELWFAEAFDKLAKDCKVLVHQIEGKWYTTGDPLRMLQTTFEFAMQRDDLREPLTRYLIKRLTEIVKE